MRQGSSLVRECPSLVSLLFFWLGSQAFWPLWGLESLLAAGPGLGSLVRGGTSPVRGGPSLVSLLFFGLKARPFGPFGALRAFWLQAQALAALWQILRESTSLVREGLSLMR